MGGLCQALLAARADPRAKNCESRHALDHAMKQFYRYKNEHCAETAQRFATVVSTIDSAFVPPSTDIAQEAAARRRRRRRVTYLASDRICIAFRADDDAREAVVASIAAT